MALELIPLPRGPWEKGEFKTAGVWNLYALLFVLIFPRRFANNYVYSHQRVCE